MKFKEAKMHNSADGYKYFIIYRNNFKYIQRGK